MKNFMILFATTIAAFFCIIGMIVLMPACQPLASAADALASACENDLTVSSPIILEAEKRGIPAAKLAKTFCAAKDIYDLWDTSKKKLGGASATNQALDLLRVRGEI